MKLEEIFTVENLQQMATICGAIIFTVYMSFKTFKQKLDKVMVENKSEVSKKVNKQSKLDCEIMEVAENLKEEIGADRVHVCEFHNGMHYANGRSALKMSCTYEACKYGVIPRMALMSNVPLSIMPVFYQTLFNKGEFGVKNIEQIKQEMPSTYALKSNADVVGFYTYVISNKEKEPVGYIEVEFCKLEEKPLNKDLIKKFAWFVETKLDEMN